MWYCIKNVEKHILMNHGKKSKVYAVRHDLLMEEECEKPNIHLDLKVQCIPLAMSINAKIDSPSHNKYVYYKGTPKFNALPF